MHRFYKEEGLVITLNVSGWKARYRMEDEDIRVVSYRPSMVLIAREFDELTLNEKGLVEEVLKDLMVRGRL